jgi:hypothetical protein
MSRASFSLEQPMSMNIFSLVTTFVLSSADMRWGGLAAMIPPRMPFTVRTLTLWPSSTWSNHPPSGLKVRKPWAFTPETTKPTSSTWPGSRTTGPPDFPFTEK